MAAGLNDMKDMNGLAAAGDFAADYFTSSLVLRY
jgi:hypothetical protein